jgi:hypothetical protein
MAHDNAEHLRYTEDELQKNLVLLEGHGKSYPCPECTNKHLLNIEGLAEEGSLMTENEDKRNWFLNLAEWSRNKRRELSDMT